MLRLLATLRVMETKMQKPELNDLIKTYKLNKLIEETPPEQIASDWHASIIWKATIQSIEALIELNKKAA